jgi:glutathione S-transferase
MKARLYAGPASHPSKAAALMLDHKGIEFETSWLLLLLGRFILRLRGFSGGTVPALDVANRRVQGSRQISRVLDELVPEPLLFPADPSLRRAVEAAECFGERELQNLARRIVVWSMRQRSDLAIEQLSAARKIDGARFTINSRMMRLTSKPVVSWYARQIGADDKTVRADLERLPGLLDRIDELVATGVLGGQVTNAADFQIATSLGQLMTVDELHGYIEPRPAGQLSRRLVPDYPGRSSGILPPEWLARASIRPGNW